MAKLFTARLSSSFSQVSALDRTVFVKQFTINLTGANGVVSLLTLQSTPKLKIDIDALDLPLVSNTTYSIVVNDGVVTDSTYPGFTSVPQNISYTTDAGPSISEVAKPSNGDKLYVKFNYRIKESGTGDILVYKSDDTLVSKYNTSIDGINGYSKKPIINNKTLILNTGGKLSENSNYYVQSQNGALKDYTNNASSLISKKLFTTGDNIFHGLKSNMLSAFNISASGTKSSFIFNITVPAGQTLTIGQLSFFGSSITINWGQGVDVVYNTQGTKAAHTYGNGYGLMTPDFQQYSGASHTYATAGTYKVVIVGQLTEFIPNNGTGTNLITSIISLPDTLYFMNLGGLTNLTSVPAVVPSYMTYVLFTNCTSFNSPNISSWNTLSFQVMDRMFYGCTAFNQPLNSWDTSRVQSMEQMFYGCAAFNRPLNNWDTSLVGVFKDVQPLAGMNNMFNSASAFNQNISSWDVHNITSKPTGFDTNTNAGWTTAAKPQWGTTGSH